VEVISGTGLNEPSHNVIFIRDVLYLFAGNANISNQNLEKGESLIEDVYTFDLSKIDDGFRGFLLL